MIFSSTADASVPISSPEPVPQLLRDLVHERTGVHFEAERLGLMLEKLEPRARFHGCRSYLDYYYILKYDEKGGDEWRRVMDAFSVQETFFWREMDQVRMLVDHFVPQWFSQHAMPLRIWSAACATGEEPYTIAMALREAGWGNHPIEIMASDASEAALARARTGIYRDRSFRSLPSALKEKYFEAAAEGYRISPEISSRVRFEWANLARLDELPGSEGCQVVFCRNVFIYFSQDSIREVVASFAHRMPTGSLLLVGASESLLKLTSHFDLQDRHGAFAYVRNSLKP